MKKYLLCMSLVLVVGAGQLMAEKSSDVVLSATPLRVFHIGEPLALCLSLTNSTDKPIEIEVDLDDLRDIGVSFTCEGVRPPVSGIAPFVRDSRVTYVGIGPKQEIKRVIALNSYLTFTKPGKYTVTYRGEFLGPIGTTATYSSNSTFEVTIEDGPIDEKWIKELINDLGQEGQPVAIGARWKNPKDKDKDRIIKGETAELLQWADTPMAIEPLIAAAKDKDLPNASPDIVRSLGKFFREHERARTGVLEIADKRDDRAFQAALDVYEEQGVTIPSEWFKPTLTSKYGEKILKSLEYLKKHSKSEDAELVEPLLKNKNERIAGLAKQIVDELRARKPQATMPATQAGTK